MVPYLVKHLNRPSAMGYLLKAVFLLAVVALSNCTENAEKAKEKPKRSLNHGDGWGGSLYSGLDNSAFNTHTHSHTVDTVTKEVGVPQPYPVTITKQVHVPVYQPYPVHVPKPYAVPVEVKVPVEVPKPYPIPVTRDVPYPVEKPVYVKVFEPVKVEVPQPYPVLHPVEVKVPTPYYIRESSIGHGVHHGSSDLGHEITYTTSHVSGLGSAEAKNGYFYNGVYVPSSSEVVNGHGSAINYNSAW